MKRSIVLAALVVLVAATAYFWHRSSRDHEHEQFEVGQWRLRQLDAMFNEDLLRARFSLLENYDPFERYLSEMERLTADLRAAPRFVDAAGRASIAERADRFHAILLERRRLVEQFESRNAVLANSRRYFPVAVGQLLQGLQENPSGKVLREIMQQLTNALIGSEAGSADSDGDALLAMERLKAWTRDNPRRTEAGLVASLIPHARQLVVGKSELDALVSQLLALPTDELLQELSSLYENELAHALGRTQQYRALLFGLAGLLVAGISLAFRAQWQANLALEARVAARTAELEAEVEERRRTADALQASESFFHSLVDNLPVFIFRKDLTGKITFANKLFCTRIGLPNAEIVGSEPFAFLAPDDAAKQRKIEEEIVRTGAIYEARDERIDLRGTLTFIHLIKVPVLDASGRCVGLQGMFMDVTERKMAEAELDRLNRELMATSRRAGMAEVATGVLHNVGNVLNSVNVSATLVIDQVRESKSANLAKIGAMLKEHASDLADFLARDPRGQHIPAYLISLEGKLTAERALVIEELGHLRKNIEHIRGIVELQQSHAKCSGVSETVTIAELVEDSLRMNANALVRHGIAVGREFEPGLMVTVDRHKVLQVLVNLIGNAKCACNDSGLGDKRIKIHIRREADAVAIDVVDNGVGIPAENLTRIFGHGFTTRRDGHGFGLHSGALAAQELGGTLTATSDGPGRGATFTLRLPAA